MAKGSCPSAAIGGRPAILVPTTVFLVVLAIHANSRVLQSSDSVWSVHLGLSIAREGNTDLDEYSAAVLSGDRYLYEVVDGHIYSSFPVGTPLLAAPLVYLADEAIRSVARASPRAEAFLRGLCKHPIERVDAVSLHRPVEVLVASVFVAAAAVIVYIVGSQFVSRHLSLALTGIFAFCTPAWSTASRALWQHGPSMLMLAAALLLAVASRRRPSLIQYASLPLAFSYVVRPTNAISIAAFTLFLVIRRRRYLLRYLAWSLVVVLPFLVYNLAIYHRILAPYYLPQRVGAAVHFAEALVGNLFSPARGLLVFCPVLAFGLFGIALMAKSEGDHLLDYLLVGVVVVHWLVISSFPHWYGGHSYGPRFFTDMMPYMVYFLIPVVAWLAETRGAFRGCLVAVFLLLVLFGFLIHLNGGTNTATYHWNVDPVNVDTRPDRIWDWTDPQFLRGIAKK